MIYKVSPEQLDHPTEKPYLENQKQKQTTMTKNKQTKNPKEKNRACNPNTWEMVGVGAGVYLCKFKVYLVYIVNSKPARAA